MDAIWTLRYLRRLRRKRHLQILRENRIQIRHLRDTSDPFQLSDLSFQGLYRLSKGLVRGLIDELRPLLADGARVTFIPVEIKVLCALHFYGQGSYQRSAGSDRNVSMSQPSVSRAVKEITEALNSPQILGNWIVFPQGQRERIKTIQKNYRVTAIPGVLGFVDGTHISMKTPSEDKDLFLNRRKYHSINAQIVCDSGMRILNVLARYPGSTHDSFIWKNSAVRKRLVDIWATGERCWLLGDSDYPHEPWLHTPILNAEEGSPEARYQRHHTRAYSAVKRCIGLLKGRFRCLLLPRKLEYSPQKVGQIINACCVLHNMCILGGVAYPEEEIRVDEDDPVGSFEEDGARAFLHAARMIREMIIGRLLN